jgi:hypothetical protein
MAMQLDHDLTLSRWEVLKGLRRAGAELHVGDGLAISELVELGLATLEHGRPLITTEGRQVLLRGSTQLWDVAA